jgi:hypothetical protein
MVGLGLGAKDRIPDTRMVELEPWSVNEDTQRAALHQLKRSLKVRLITFELPE